MKPDTSVVICVYNGADTLADSLRAVGGAEFPARTLRGDRRRRRLDRRLGAHRLAVRRATAAASAPRTGGGEECRLAGGARRLGGVHRRRLRTDASLAPLVAPGRGARRRAASACSAPPAASSAIRRRWRYRATSSSREGSTPTGTCEHPTFPFAPSGNAMYRREALAAVNGFDERYSSYESCDLHTRLRRSGRRRLPLRATRRGLPPSLHDLARLLSPATRLRPRPGAVHVALSARGSVVARTRDSRRGVASLALGAAALVPETGDGALLRRGDFLRHLALQRRVSRRPTSVGGSGGDGDPVDGRPLEPASPVAAPARSLSPSAGRPVLSAAGSFHLAPAGSARPPAVARAPRPSSARRRALAPRTCDLPSNASTDSAARGSRRSSEARNTCYVRSLMFCRFADARGRRPADPLARRTAAGSPETGSAAMPGSAPAAEFCEAPEPEILARAKRFYTYPAEDDA